MEDLGASASPAAAEVSPSADGALWIDRQTEARRVLDFVLSSRSRLVILYGKHGIGKTALIQRWVMPSVPEGCEAFYGECDPELPPRVAGAGGELELAAAMARPRALIFLDSFEALLDLSDDRREELLADLGARVRSGECVALLVLVLAEDRLGRAFSLRAELPELAHATLEIKGITSQESVAALHSVAQQSALNCAPAVLDELAREADALDSRREGVSPELLKVIGAQLQSIRPPAQPQLELDEYRAMGGLASLLRGFLDRQLELLPSADGSGRELGLAVLEEVATAQREARAPELSGLAERLEQTAEELRRAIAWLQGDGGLLRERKEGGLEVVPQGLARIVEKEASQRRRDTRESQWILSEGVRAWNQVGSLPARETFDRVDRLRRRLDVSDDEAELMLRCALRYQPEENLRGARYWVQRIRTEQSRVEILQLSLFDPLPAVRGKAAALLGRFPRPEVRDQLHLLALKDPEERVRAAAVESLRQMKSDELRAPLVQEARDEMSPYRAEAVDALRIFAEEPTVAVLKDIVDRPGSEGRLRRKAIEALAALQIDAAAAALVEIALRDEDEDDRAGAAAGLGSLQAEILVRNCLEKLRAARWDTSGRRGLARLRSWLPSLGVGTLAVLVGIANLFLHGIALIAIGRRLLGGLIFLAELAGIGVFFVGGCLALPWFAATLGAAQLIPAALLLRERRQGQLQLDTFRGALALLLFTTTALPMTWMLHGLAHALVGRWRRAAALFASQLVGVLLLGANQYALFRGMSPEIRELYVGLGWILFAGSFLWDVVPVLRDAALRSEFAQRRWAAYREMLRGRVAPGLVLERLNADRRSDRRWARSLLRHDGGEIEPGLLLSHLREGGRVRGFVVDDLARHKSEGLIDGLRDLWEEADPDLRRTIVSILARQPTEASLDALERLRDGMTPWQRLRWGLSRWHFRVRVWPKAILVSGLLALPLISAAVYDKFYPYKPHVRLIEDRKEAVQQRVYAAEYLAKAYPEATAHALAQAFRDTRELELRLGLAHSLGLIATTPEVIPLAPQKEALQALLGGLDVPGGAAPEELRAAVVAELKTVGQDARGILDGAGVSQELAARLNGAPDVAVRRGALEVLEAARAVQTLSTFVHGGDDETLRAEAILALGRIGTLESVQALRQLHQAPLPESLRTQVDEELKNPLRPLEDRYAAGDYLPVVREGRLLLEDPQEAELKPRLLNLVGKAECSLRQWYPLAPEKCVEHLEAARAAGSADSEALRLLATRPR